MKRSFAGAGQSLDKFSGKISATLGNLTAFLPGLSRLTFIVSGLTNAFGGLGRSLGNVESAAAGAAAGGAAGAGRGAGLGAIFGGLTAGRVALITAGIAGLGGVLTAIKLKQFANKTAEVTDQLARMSDRTGVAVRDLSSLRVAAELSSVPLETLATSIQRMNRRAADAARGSEEFAKGFRILGVDIKDTNGEIKSGLPLFLEVGDALGKMENQALKTSAGFKIFDTEGGKLFALFKGGRGELDEIIRLTERMGLVLGDDMADAAERLRKEQRLLNVSWEGLQFTLGQVAIPALIEFNVQLTQLITSASQAAQSVKSLFGVFAAPKETKLKLQLTAVESALRVVRGEAGLFETAMFKIRQSLAKGAQAKLQPFAFPIGKFFTVQPDTEAELLKLQAKLRAALNIEKPTEEGKKDLVGLGEGFDALAKKVRALGAPATIFTQIADKIAAITLEIKKARDQDLISERGQQRLVALLQASGDALRARARLAGQIQIASLDAQIAKTAKLSEQEQARLNLARIDLEFQRDIRAAMEVNVKTGATSFNRTIVEIANRKRILSILQLSGEATEDQAETLDAINRLQQENFQLQTRAVGASEEERGIIEQRRAEIELESAQLRIQLKAKGQLNAESERALALAERQFELSKTLAQEQARQAKLARQIEELQKRGEIATLDIQIRQTELGELGAALLEEASIKLERRVALEENLLQKEKDKNFNLALANQLVEKQAELQLANLRQQQMQLGLIVDQQQELTRIVEDTVTSAQENMSEALTTFFQKGKLEAADFASFFNNIWNNLVREMTDSFTKTLFTGLRQALGQNQVAGGGAGGLFSNLLGGVGGLLKNILPFQHGGIVTKPTLGLLAEKRAEAVIPLDKLGKVEAAQESQAEPKGTTIINVFDRSQLNAVIAGEMSKNRGVIVNDVLEQIRNNGPLRRAQRKFA